jgi:transcriptional regulator with XRE-family HTH domain
VISDLERSKHNASIDLLDRLARALKVDVAIFFTSPDPADPRPEPLKPGRKSHK